MSVRSAERRRSRRKAASHHAAVFTRSGALVARGKTSNISENGVFLLARIDGKTPVSGRVTLELVVPDASNKPNRSARMRTVRFSARIIRTVRLGHLVGLGIEFDEQFR